MITIPADTCTDRETYRIARPVIAILRDELSINSGSV